MDDRHKIAKRLACAGRLLTFDYDKLSYRNMHKVEEAIDEMDSAIKIAENGSDIKNKTVRRLRRIRYYTDQILQDPNRNFQEFEDVTYLIFNGLVQQIIGDKEMEFDEYVVESAEEIGIKLSS